MTAYAFGWSGIGLPGVRALLRRMIIDLMGIEPGRCWGF